MATSIRKYLRDFIAITVLVALAAGVSYYIVQEQRLRIPILEERPFEFKAEFDTAQGVVAGQGRRSGSPAFVSVTSRASRSRTAGRWSPSPSTASSCRSTATRRS